MADVPHGDACHASHIVSSIEFDKDSEFFATAGVLKRIKVFDFRAALLARADAPLPPVLEVSTRSKLSCLTYSKGAKALLCSSDYEGVVALWDTSTSACVAQFGEVRRLRGARAGRRTP